MDNVHSVLINASSHQEYANGTYIIKNLKIKKWANNSRDKRCWLEEEETVREWKENQRSCRSDMEEWNVYMETLFCHQMAETSLLVQYLSHEPLGTMEELLSSSPYLSFLPFIFFLVFFSLRSTKPY